MNQYINEQSQLYLAKLAQEHADQATVENNAQPENSAVFAPRKKKALPQLRAAWALLQTWFTRPG